ncbi:erbin isoform X1 [Patella vulgata]|uniref:erbin isoform X1 n=1 Tax=Patella vulgata TaxID=6465 RepID=UPI0024A98675|nr:erbin isoform X1 [Patella vulgata]XP_050403944.2 erbin isoform X1 [Patella vulgata]
MVDFVRKCPCLKPQIEDDITTLDYRHCSLADVPSEVFNFERTLEELLTDSNQIRDLPRELFYCHGIRKLSISDNEIINIPPAISSLINLEELNFSKNGIIDVPDTIKQCKLLSVIDASVNPLGKLPDGFTQLQNLTHLFLNDTFLDYLPGSFGRLTKLRIFEIRENHLKTLPQSFGRLVELERLDIGNNEFTELPECIGNLVKLSELWCDTNQIKVIPCGIGNLKELMFLDASKNKIHSVPTEIEGCVSLADIHLTANRIQELPESLGNLNNLTTLKIDDNHLTSLPKSIGGLTSLSELNVSTNDLELLPASIGFLRNLRTFYADENLIEVLPPELGSCNGLTVLSLRGNKLTYIPDELGRIPKLRVLNLSDNSLKYLPFSVVKLKELQALWLTENQTKPLIPLQSEHEAETGRKILTCYLLPQQPGNYQDERDGDTDSFHPSIWEEERRRRQKIHFEFGDDVPENERLVRCPTPYPKDLREKARHARNLMQRQTKSDKDHYEGRENYGYEPEGSTNSPILGRENKPVSPSLRETHRLYRYDKEKFMKDKARIHYHEKNEAEESVLKSPKPKRHGLEGRMHKKGLGEHPSNRSRRPGSNPDIPTSVIETNNVAGTKPDYDSAKWKVDALNYKQLVFHHHHKGHHNRRMREYDSDTGYRSDQDVVRFRKQYLNDDRANVYDMNTKTLPHSTHHSSNQQKAKRDNGYTSDLDAYVSQTRNAAYKHISLSQQFGAHSVPYDLHERSQELRSDFPSSASNTQRRSDYGSAKNYEYIQNLGNHGNQYQENPRTESISDPNRNVSLSKGDLSVSREVNSITVLPSPSPSLFQRSRFIDQSTPVCADPAQDGRLSISSSEENNNAKDWKRELYTVLEENMARAASNPKLNYSSQSIESASHPPAYQPAPPYYRSPSVSERDHLDSPRSQSSSRAGSSDRVSDHSLQKRLSDPSVDPRCGVGELGISTLPRTRRSGSREMIDRDLQPSPRERSRSQTLETSDSHPFSGVYDQNGSAIGSVMSRYDDIAMFKSDPSSQVSSSTDSGYGHGHHTYERVGEFSNKYSGLNSSPSPQSHATVSRNSSSSREYLHSRETTPTESTGASYNKIMYVDDSSIDTKDVFQVQISKNPGLGFSIAGGSDSHGNPFRPDDMGIFVTKVQSNGPAKHTLRRGDKILKVNGTDFTSIDHNRAVSYLKNNTTVCLLVERIQKVNLV